MIRSSLLSLALLFGSGPAALAESFLQSDVLEAHLREGWRDGSKGRHVMALDMQLAPGWKTYWRAPGDAGIPPSFDWSGSENLASVQFHWPSPEVFLTNGTISVGYHDGLILPIEVTAKDSHLPIRLRVRVDLGICKDICLPATLDLAADLPVGGAKDPIIVAALKARPKTPKEARVQSVACRVEPIRDGLRITATLLMPAHGPDEYVVIEPGIPGIWVSEALVSRQNSTLTAMVEMVPPNAAPFAIDRRDLRVTVMSTSGAVEIQGCPAP